MRTVLLIIAFCAVTSAAFAAETRVRVLGPGRSRPNFVAWREGLTLLAAIVEAGTLSGKPDFAFLVQRGTLRRFELDRIRSGELLDPPVQPGALVRFSEPPARF